MLQEKKEVNRDCCIEIQFVLNFISKFQSDGQKKNYNSTKVLIDSTDMSSVIFV